jgi:mannose-6-phosphate isomerase-like protein (cupin superfamily)
MKVVRKPWGKEVWLELNDRYCYKRIYLNAGERTSFQYHEKKKETNYIISGEAEIWLEDDAGEIQKTKMGPDDFFTVVPPRKHRVVALTDLILQEVSTPEVDDVFRIQDEWGRLDGKIDHEHQNPALCIIAAGKGSRMEHLTEHTHKGLLPVEDKAVISHIIEKAPVEYDIVIAVGHLGYLIREYCEISHPDRNFIFCEVDKIEGEGTGPGYSINACKEHLQRPFYFCVADCMIRDELPSLSCNWLGVYPTGIPELYSTVKFDSDMNIVGFTNKCPNGFDHAFIGLAGILDYETFWDQLGDSGEVVKAFYNPSVYDNFKVQKLDWVDVGTIDGYLKARSNKYSLPKTTGESIYKIGDVCVRLFPNGTAMQRFDRAKNLHGLVPQNHKSNKHVMSYFWEEGKTLYSWNDRVVYEGFLGWCLENLWEDNYNPEYQKPEDVAKKFYIEKTFERFEKYVKQNPVELNVVNGRQLDTVENYLKRVPWDKLGECRWTSRYHGDLQFDNVIYDGEKFCLIDWRHDFGGNETWGDAYYDVAKLYGGTLINYSLMKSPKNISLTASKEEVDFFYNHNDTLIQFRPLLEEWIKCWFDFEKVRLLTGLIWLNMSPLHEQPFSDMLFYKAKEMLANVLD